MPRPGCGFGNPETLCERQSMIRERPSLAARKRGASGTHDLMAHIPVQVSALLQQLTARLPIILGGNLVGIYLYGSLTQRAFNAKHSDVDCLVVTHRALSEAQFKKLDD